ncbi:hypothetical protein [Novosphingopyxis sp.]|uniref:hypothetical protein n=1 Tax=Novosphingopyxis sp. TaxID=2709690 RepID=UPI003B58F46E
MVDRRTGDVADDAMTEDRIIMAIGRIERALARIESSGGNRTHFPDSSDLAQRHEALRAETRRAIGEIDDLLDGLN